jgi:soluble lytic murein transglycosylase-like protein
MPAYDIPPHYKPATINCVVHAANYQGVPANVLLAIGSVEGGKNGQAVRNKNGTYDLGHMQINTSTYKAEIAKYGISMDDVRFDGCKNVEIAAYLLKKRLSESNGQDFWTKVANYHSKTPMYNTIYKEKIQPRANKWGQWLQSQYQQAKIIYE